MPQLRHPQPPRHFHHLHEDLLQSGRVPGAEMVQRPVVGRRASCQKAQRHVLPDPLLQPPRRGDAQCIGVKPDLHHQSRVIRPLPFLSILAGEGPQIQSLHHLMHKETQMVSPQHIAYTGRHQPGLIRLVGQKLHGRSPLTALYFTRQ